MWPMSKRMVLAPIPTGRGGNGVGAIIAGVALVAFSLLLPGIGAAIGGATMTKIGLVGAAMLFGGVAQLLTPTPQMPTVGAIGGGATTGRSESDQLKSFTFDKSNANTKQGEVVPVLYGERIIGSLPVLSFGLELQNYL
jgi:predicted phage tail protein